MGQLSPYYTLSALERNRPEDAPFLSPLARRYLTMTQSRQPGLNPAQTGSETAPVRSFARRLQEEGYHPDSAGLSKSHVVEFEDIPPKKD